MSNPTVIHVQNISKIYNLYSSPLDRVKEALHPLRRQYHRDFYALKDIVFSIRQGESVGIIGKNGSGKSTLLKILTGVLSPTCGRVVIDGKVSALLELGAGFNPELSGVENVFFNGLLMGYTREAMRGKLDEILAFADIGDFCHQPVKTYSSGMFVRLAFAVAVNVDPEILIVDEALSVGDIFFQQKCYKKIREVIARGATLLFVSHDTSAITTLCSRTLLMENGQISYDGASIAGVSRYVTSLATKPEITSQSEIPNFAKVNEIDNDEFDQIKSQSLLAGTEKHNGSGGITVDAIRVLGSSGHNSLRVVMQDFLIIQIILTAQRKVFNLNTVLHLFDRFGNTVFACGTKNLHAELPPIGDAMELMVAFKIYMNVQPGEYTFSIGVSEPSLEGPNIGHVLDRVDMLGPICVVASPDEVQPFWGIAQLPMELNKIMLRGIEEAL